MSRDTQVSEWLVRKRYTIAVVDVVNEAPISKPLTPKYLLLALIALRRTLAIN